jgi:hypothetical protein
MLSISISKIALSIILQCTLGKNTLACGHQKASQGEADKHTMHSSISLILSKIVLRFVFNDNNFE